MTNRDEPAARIASASLRLGIVSAAPAVRTAPDRLAMIAANGRLVGELRRLFPHSRLCVSLVDSGLPAGTHEVQCPAEDIVPLPPMPTTIGAQKYFWTVWRTLRRFARSVDVIYLRAPLQIPLAAAGIAAPIVLHVVNDPAEIVRVSDQYPGLLGILARRFARHSEAMMRRLAAKPNCRVVTNGQAMFDKLRCPRGRSVVSAGMYEREMIPRAQYDLGKPPRLLFVGYLRPEKGVTTLIEAFETVRARQPVKLTIVGAAEPPSPAETRIRERIATSPYAADIELRGNVSFGEPLFDLYRSHDVFVLPSLSEGTPRTLTEARALGCPVVATRVGGIPTSVRDGTDGLLFPPGDAPALAAALESLLHDEPLRRRLIVAGIARAREFSIESFAWQIAEELLLAAGAKPDHAASGVAALSAGQAGCGAAESQPSHLRPA